MRRLPGCYEHFPEAIHGIAQFTHRLSVKKLQQAILNALHCLNQETYSLNTIIPFSSLKCEVSFEFGIADGNVFNYLDKEELDSLQRDIAKKALSTIDFLCVVRYYVAKREKRVPLKFDYHLLRLMFQKRNMQLQIFHERGTQRVSLEDLITFVTKCIKDELSQKQLKPLSLKYSRTL